MAFELDFPNGTVDRDIFFTSDSTKRYNCIAWSVGLDHTWIWPDEHGAWPVDLPREESVENFKSFYSLFGFEECPDARPEKDFERVALYCDANSSPSHAARGLKEGGWTSKLGRGIDIRHELLRNIETTNYGMARYFFKRRWGTKVQPPKLHDPQKGKLYMPWDNG